jgi:hypothetical protein
VLFISKNHEASVLKSSDTGIINGGREKVFKTYLSRLLAARDFTKRPIRPHAGRAPHVPEGLVAPEASERSVTGDAI